MFDRIFDFLAAAWEWFIPWVIIDAYEMGVILQLGKFRRVIGPGIRLMCPFGIDACKYETVVRQTTPLDMQSLTTKDYKSCTMNAILTYKITDIKKFLLEIDDGESDIQNMCIGIISNATESNTWKYITTTEFNNQVKNRCRRICDKYCGVQLLDLTWSDKTLARPIRLLQ